MSSWTVNRIQVDPPAVSVKCKTKNSSRIREAPYKRGTKKIVYNAYKYFKQQKDDTDSLEYKTDSNISKLVAIATGVQECTAKRIISEGKTAILKTGKPTFRNSKRTKRAKFNVNDYHLGQNFNVNDYHFGHIRKVIYQMYTVEKVFPSLRTLAAVLKQNDIIDFCKKILRRLLLTIGYYYAKRDKKRSILLERPDIIEKRFEYLLSMLKCRSKNENNIFFIGETKIDPIAYGDVGQESGLHMVVAGNRNGLIADSVGIYESIEGLTVTMFHDWVEQKLKNQLPPNSVVIMGNESYHCMQEGNTPTMESLKHEMHECLHKHGIHFAIDLSKVELMKIINSIPLQQNYKVHKILQGHTVLHIPPFHIDLNPMWPVLKDIKEQLLRECVLTFDEKSRVLKRLVSEYHSDRYQMYDDVISSAEREYWSYDMKMDNALDELIQGTKGGDTIDSDTDDFDSAISDEDNYK